MHSDRIRSAVECGNGGASADLFSEAATFCSPVLFKPYQGRDQVVEPPTGGRAGARAWLRVPYVHPLKDPHDRGRDPRNSQPWYDREQDPGTDKLTFDEDGMLTELKVMIRLASALQLVGVKMAEEFRNVGLPPAELSSIRLRWPRPLGTRRLRRTPEPQAQPNGGETGSIIGGRTSSWPPGSVFLMRSRWRYVAPVTTHTETLEQPIAQFDATEYAEEEVWHVFEGRSTSRSTMAVRRASRSGRGRARRRAPRSPHAQFSAGGRRRSPVRTTVGGLDRGGG
jgi:hypothetical protein